MTDTPRSPAPINVVMTFDASFAPHAGVALYSLLASNAGRNFHVLLLCAGLTQEDARKLIGLGAAFGSKIVLRTVDAEKWRVLQTNNRISEATYFRFLIPFQFDADVSKVLYLDSDLIVDGDIGPLWEMDLAGSALAACRDIGCQQSRHAPLGLSPSHHYFNAGVLLIDLAAWRNEEVSQRAIAFLRQRPEDAVFLDQDALNVCLQDRVRYLSCVWNFMPLLKFTRFQDDFPAIESGRLKPAIVHFAGGRKPWLMARESNPWVRRYWDIRDRSPWGEGGLAEGPHNPLIL
jgi:lipopolysaccharide biosynthesis glycosyltransferase